VRHRSAVEAQAFRRDRRYRAVRLLRDPQRDHIVV